MIGIQWDLPNCRIREVRMYGRNGGLALSL